MKFNDLFKWLITCKNFIVAILPLKLHLSTDVDIFNMVFVLCHSLQNSKFHIYHSLGTDFNEVLYRNPTFQLFQIIVLIHPKDIDWLVKK